MEDKKKLSRGEEIKQIDELVDRIVEIAKENKIDMYDYERFKNNLRFIFLGEEEKIKIRELEE